MGRGGALDPLPRQPIAKKAFWLQALPRCCCWQRFASKYRANGLQTIWGHAPDSGVRPCAVYLRHCVLAAERMGAACLASFLDETYLIDRTTTIRQYLEQHPEIMSTPPPLALAERYGG